MPKRTSSGSSEFQSRPAKRARISADSELSVDEFFDLSRDKLESFPQETLVEYILDLQAAYRDIPSAPATSKGKASAVLTDKSANAKAVDSEKVKNQAGKLADMIKSGITKQMKWQPSCKHGGKRWTYSSMVPSPAVFYELFQLEEGKKAWKQKKIPLDDFENITGGLYASIRYGTLRVVSKDVTLKWDKDTNSFTVSGMYGL